MKDRFMVWYRRIGPFIFSGVGWWLAYELYISPLTNQNDLVIADPIYIFSFMFGASIGFLAFLPLIIRHILANSDFCNKVFFGWLAVLGVAGMIGNAVLYKVVIEPNGYIECPKKIGYKKNLLRDYVLDVNQCEKF